MAVVFIPTSWHTNSGQNNDNTHVLTSIQGHDCNNKVIILQSSTVFPRQGFKSGYHFYLTCVCTSSPVTIFPTALRAADTTWVRSCLNEIKSNCYQIQYIVQQVPPSFNLKGSLIICACSGNSCQNRSSCSRSAEFLKQLSFSLHMCSS